ncbi:MAG: hypothetical protein K1X35_10830 [Caulobacteraceae bacterium]|nr:hypothetical protein [Caulobacteraceae bacterium]
MNAVVQSAHQAYREANALIPAKDKGAPRAPVFHDALVWSQRETDIPARHLVAAGGAVLFLIAGALCGAWMAG